MNNTQMLMANEACEVCPMMAEKFSASREHSKTDVDIGHEHG